MPIFAIALVVVGLVFVGRGVLLTRPGASFSRPAWMPVPSKRGLGLAALAIAPLALIAAAYTSQDKAPEAAAAPWPVDRLTDGDAKRADPKAQAANEAPSGAAPAAAPQDAAPASARRQAPANAPSEPERDEPGRPGDTTVVTDPESEQQPTPEPERPKGKGKPKNDEPSPTPAPTPSGDDGDDRDD